MKLAFLKEFRDFAVKGNVVDMAVGVIIGGAFGKIVSSFVSDVVMPPLGLLIGGVDFKHFSLTLKAAEGDVPATVLNYGMFIQNVFDFIIIAFAIFLAIKALNKVRNSSDKKTPPTNEEVLLTEIRDLLKSQHDSKK